MILQAGAAIRDISPGRPMPLAGYPGVRRISTGIHDPLLISVLYLRRESAGVLLCSVELLMLNSDVVRNMRRKVAEAVGIPEACVLISCTHTHSAPVSLRYLPFNGDVSMPAPDPSYLRYVTERVVEAAVDAKQRLQPAAMAWTSGGARGVGGNRKTPNGPTDPEVGILAVRAAGKPLAVATI